MIPAWNSLQHKEVQSACLISVGEGDGGGGTLRADLEMVRRLKDMEGFPRTAWKTASTALAEIFAAGEFPVWRGELYLEIHRGTYTTQARTKRNNRKLEYALRAAELYNALATLDGKGEYPRNELLDCWKNTLTNQFHDIIPGSSITKVYAEAEKISARMLDTLNSLSFKARVQLVGLNENDSAATGNAMYVFNDLSWERISVVSLPAAMTGKASVLGDVDGMVYSVQCYADIDGKEQAVFAPKVPSLGWARFSAISTGAAAVTGMKSPFVWHDNMLETPFYKITLDENGRITSLINRRQNREMVAPGGAFNAFISAEDVPVFWDAWDIDADWVKHIKKETRLLSTEVVAEGPVCFRLRFKYEIGEASHLVQDMVCYANDPRVDFETKVDWHEKWRLLKVEFDTVIDASQVRCEIQYGHLWRNTHRNLMQDRAKFEICAHKWISLEEEGSGIALLNDCKYGHDVEGGRMRLSLLRSPIAPDPEADRGVHYFTYSILPFTGNFGSSSVIQSAYELNSPMPVLAGTSALADTAETNSPAQQSFCSVDGNQVIIESVKMPENGTDSELILRLYECLGGKSRTTLHFNRELHSAAETDMLEENPQPLRVQGKNLVLEFRPFEIKTLRVKFR
jgi:alpha-mannosidase